MGSSARKRLRLVVLLAAIAVAGCGSPEDRLAAQQSAICREALQAARDVARHQPDAIADATRRQAKEICENGAQPAPVGPPE